MHTNSSFHFFSAAILYRPDQSYDDVKVLARQISARAISLQGTASGEHGVVRDLLFRSRPQTRLIYIVI